MTSGRPVLIVQTAGVRLAIDAQHVRGVRGVPQTTPLPRSPPTLLGVFHHEGNVLPLYDLIAITHGDIRTHRPRVVIVQAGEHEIGILVEEVLELLPLPQVVLTRADPTLPPVLAATVEGRLRPGASKDDDATGPQKGRIIDLSSDGSTKSEAPLESDAPPDAEDPELRKRLEEILEGAPEWLRRIHLQDGKKREQAMTERAQQTLESDPPVHLVDMKRLVDTLSRSLIAPSGGATA